MLHDRKAEGSGGDGVIRIAVFEIEDRNSAAFDEILEMAKCCSDIRYLRLRDEPVVSLPGLEIYLDRRKIYHNRREIRLTTKEYDILCLLVANRGCVLTYGQISSC